MSVKVVNLFRHEIVNLTGASITVAAAGRHAVERRRRRQVKYSVAVWQRKEIKERLLRLLRQPLFCCSPNFAGI
jgi:hypothetical protein